MHRPTAAKHLTNPLMGLALAVFGGLLPGLGGCYGGDAGGTESSTGAEASGSASATYDLELCVDWCLHRSACQEAGATESDCETLCNPTYQGTPQACHDEVDAIYRCAGALQCDVEEDFDIDDPEGPCRETIAAYRTCVGG